MPMLSLIRSPQRSKHMPPNGLLSVGAQSSSRSFLVNIGYALRWQTTTSLANNETKWDPFIRFSKSLIFFLSLHSTNASPIDRHVFTHRCFHLSFSAPKSEVLFIERPKKDLRSILSLRRQEHGMVWYHNMVPTIHTIPYIPYKPAAPVINFARCACYQVPTLVRDHSLFVVNRLDPFPSISVFSNRNKTHNFYDLS